jgi:hypothetical protein
MGTFKRVFNDWRWKEWIAYWRKAKKRRPLLKGRLALKFGPGRSGATGTLGAAAGAAGAEVDTAVQLEAVLMKIHLDGLGFLQKFRVDDKFKTVNVKRLVRIG